MLESLMVHLLKVSTW